MTACRTELRREVGDHQPQPEQGAERDLGGEVLLGPAEPAVRGGDRLRQGRGDAEGGRRGGLGGER